MKADQHRMSSQGISITKKFMTQLSTGKIMAGVLWDSEGLIHVDFLPHGGTINAQ
jgi:hypothetical protein